MKHNIKKQKKKLMLFVIILGGLLAFPQLLVGQSVSGTVTDADNGEPLIGVNVVVQGTSLGTITDATGKYTLKVPSLNDSLRFSFIGYQTKITAINGRTTINIALELETEQIEDVVVIGYGSVKSSNITGAVSVVDEKELTKTPASSFGKALQGKASGVMVTQSGSPGGDVNMRVRGIGSINMNPNPLYVIDGVVGADINSIAPEDIKSISVLKDAASQAIYGANGANGVILIETKRGKSGKTKVSFSSFASINRTPQQYDMMNADQYANFYNTLIEAQGVIPPQAYSDEFRQWYYGDGWQEGTNWQDEILQNNSYTQNYYLRVSGGNEYSNYSISGNVYDERGLLINSNAQRYTLRANSDFNIGDYVKIGESISLSRRKIQHSSNAAWNWALESSPLSKVYNPDNKEGFEGHQISYELPQGDSTVSVPNTGGNDKLNPRGVLELHENFSYRHRVTAQVYVEVNPFEWLSFRSAPSIDASFNRDHNWSPSFDMGVRSQGSASLTHDFSEGLYSAIENKVTIQKKFGNHNFNLIGVHHARKNKGYNLGAGATGFTNENLNVIDQSNPDSRTVSGKFHPHAELSYLSRLLYDYKSKYLLSASIRRDGTTNFGEERRFGTFPAFSLAWKLNKDLFPAFEPIDMFKVRVGWGQTGNSKIGSFKYSSQIASPNEFMPVFGEQVALAANELNLIGNPLIKWEAADMYNFGIDVNAIKNRIQFSAEYYLKRQNDLLLQIPVSTSLGVVNTARPWMNVGKIQNTGFEFDLMYYSQKKGNFYYNISANLSTIMNEVIDMPDPILEEYHITREGNTIGSFFGYVDQGIIQESDFEEVTELEDGTKQYSGYKYAIPSEGTPQPGDLRFKDLNRDGEITDQDRTIIGKAIPDFTYTLNIDMFYGNFDLSVFLFGMQNVQAYNRQRSTIETFVPQDMDHNKSADYAANYWTPENQSTEYLRADMDNSNNNFRFSTWWLEDASFLRVKDLQLGYTLPQNALDYLKITSARIYLSAANLYTFSNYKGRDPEAPLDSDKPTQPGVDNNAYPLPRIFSAGIRIDF